MSQRTRRERVTAWVLDILKTDGGWMSARQIADHLIDYVPKNERVYQRSRRHDTVSAVTVSNWLSHDPLVLTKGTAGSMQYAWVGDEDG